MALISFEYQGVSFICFTPEDALAEGVPQSVIDSEVNKLKELGQWSDSSSVA
ncbi:hypothetical protein AB4159_00235 [Vibrio cyclitrophicus]|uniref:hypothetical protein n=1 Tax=Vibrio coralliirubri TaxID=1516159 RepID=UPI00063425CB|nr:hypothetical protein [Vibrio coralliirubri]CDU01425.1 hypothetical protein VCR3J2_530084 [Vibrio coralliirubri]